MKSKERTLTIFEEICYIFREDYEWINGTDTGKTDRNLPNMHKYLVTRKARIAWCLYLRIVLLGTSGTFQNMLNYGSQFSSSSHHEFITTLMIPNVKREEFQKRIEGFRKTEEGKKTCVHPLFLNSSNNRLRNLLNVVIMLKDFLLIFKTLKHLSPDVIICFYVLDAYPFVLMKRILKYGLYVVAVGSDINLYDSLFHRSVRKLIYRGSNLIFAVSQALRDKIESESGYQAIVAHTGVDANFFRPLDSRVVLRKKWGFSLRDKVLLTVCNLVEHKGVDIAIRALGMLENEHSSIKLVIVGGGPEERRLKELVAELQLKSKVVFLGIRDRQEVLELCNAADVFVLASFCEGLPFTLLEALACGRICVATEVGDIPRVITHGENGFLAPKGDPVVLAKTISDALSLSEGDVHSIENRARKTVENNYDFRRQVRTMMKAIER